MSHYLTPFAETDLEDIWIRIAQDNPVTATAYLDKIVTVLEALAETPTMGVLGVAPASDVYFFPFERYNIFYEVINGKVWVLRIRHSAKDPATLRLFK
jgi:toxin ParE1/3/4